MMSINLSGIAILKIKYTNYSCIITRISKVKATNLTQNIDLTEKGGTLEINLRNQNNFCKHISKWKKRTIITFGDIEIQKQKFRNHKRSVSRKNKNKGKEKIKISIKQYKDINRTVVKGF